VVIIEEQILDCPIFFIIQTIAHELAHKIVGDGPRRIKEREANELTEKWGFSKENKLTKEFFKNPRKFGYEE